MIWVTCGTRIEIPVSRQLVLAFDLLWQPRKTDCLFSATQLLQWGFFLNHSQPGAQVEEGLSFFLFLSLYAVDRLGSPRPLETILSLFFPYSLAKG